MTTTLATYVYAIVAADAEVPGDLLGVGDATLALIPHGGIAAVVGPVDPDDPIGRRADLVAHGRVLDALAARGAVIPVRFGSVLADDQEVEDALLAPRADYFATVLAGLQGRSQFTIRARYDEETVLTEVVSENPEIAGLREQTRDRSEEASYHPRLRLGELVAQALESKREVDGQRVLEALLPHVEASNVLPGTGLDHLVEIAFLVADEQRAAFDEAAEDLARQLSPRATVRLMGPVAPHDFIPQE